MIGRSVGGFREGFMNCWMAPVIATEMWGISIEELYVRLKNGTVVSQMIGDFLLVKAACEDDDRSGGKGQPKRANREESRREDSAGKNLAREDLAREESAREKSLHDESICEEPVEAIAPGLGAEAVGEPIVTARERAALAMDFDGAAEMDPADGPVEELADEEISSISRPDISQWKRMRQAIGAKRRPPSMRAVPV